MAASLFLRESRPFAKSRQSIGRTTRPSLENALKKASKQSLINRDLLPSPKASSASASLRAVSALRRTGIDFEPFMITQ